MTLNTCTMRYSGVPNCPINSLSLSSLCPASGLHICSSCTLCRKRKIRCNRETPCSNCVRSRDAACIYEAEAVQSENPGRIAPLRPRPNNSNDANTMARPVLSGVAGHSFPAPMTPSSMTSNTSIELDAMRSRVAELESQLSQTTTTAPPRPIATSTTDHSFVVSTPTPTHPFRVTSGLCGYLDVLQDSRAFGHAPAISRAISHKNRVFGQTHWMNGFVMYRDVVDMLEPIFRSGE
jgi:hypothetical protein